MRYSFIWKPLIFLVCLLVVGGLILVLGSGHRLRHFNQIKPGATKEEVISIMGKPAESFTNVLVILRFGGNEAWAYRNGSILVEGASALLTGKGLGKRLVLPDSNDYVVVFNSSGAVSRTLKPGEGR